MDNTFQPLGVGVGTLVNNRYELVRKLGSGAMSAVYQVADRALSNDMIALKLFSPGINADSVLVERIQNEVLITRKLTAENIVRTYDFGQTREGLYFMTMEYIEGVTLDRLIYNESGRRPAFRDAVRILRDVAHGMEYAHSHGVIHRDLKPANIIISETGVVKIADFGLARAMNISHDLTQVGECVGTPFYMSPEQIQGQEVDGRSDVYSLGIIGYELVAGKTPFHDQSWYNLAQQIISSPIPELGRGCRAPAWFFPFVAKAAGKKPEHRFESAAELVKFLDEKLEAGDVLEVLPTDAKLPKVFSGFSKSLVPRSVKERRSTISIGPTQLLIGAMVLFLFALLVSLSRTNSQFQQNLNNGAETVNRMADTMNKVTKVVTFMVENKEKIEELSNGIEAKEAKPAEAPAAGAAPGGAAAAPPPDAGVDAKPGAPADSKQPGDAK